MQKRKQLLTSRLNDVILNDMKRILSFTILLLSLSVALTSCENVDLGSSQTPKYGKLDIIDRALLPEILRDEWVLKGAGFKKPYIYEKSFSFEDKAEIPLQSIKGNGDNELTFTFTKNIPATFATVQYDEPGGYTEEKHNKSTYTFRCEWHKIPGLCFNAKQPTVVNILWYTSNYDDSLRNSYIHYYGWNKEELQKKDVTKILIESSCSHVPGSPIIDGGILYMVFERK